MKTKLIILLAIILNACSKEDLPKETSQNCNCGIITNKVWFSGVNSFTRLTVKNNCTGQLTTFDVTGNIGTVGTEYCN